MLNIPECLQPAVEQLEKYQTQISSLEAKSKGLEKSIDTLSQEKDALYEKMKAERDAYELAADKFEKEKLTLRELNVVLSGQLREKTSELNALSSTKEETDAQNIHFQELNEALEKLNMQNSVLKEKNSALTSNNDARDKGEEIGNATLLAEIERLKKELLQNSDNESSFLKSENERLLQRHGQITEEKMQMSAQMHSAQKEAIECKTALEAALKRIEQLEFEHKGLQNLYKNLTNEKNTLLDQNASLVLQKAEMDEKNLLLDEKIEMISTEKELVEQELSIEHIKADALVEETNHLRMKSRVLEDELKALKEYKSAISDEIHAPKVQEARISTADEAHKAN